MLAGRQRAGGALGEGRVRKCVVEPEAHLGFALEAGFDVEAHFTDLVAPAPGRHLGLVRTTGDALAVDDVKPFLLQVPRTSPTYTEAYRLLKGLSMLVAVFPDEVPHTSLLREFIGGSAFRE